MGMLAILLNFPADSSDASIRKHVWYILNVLNKC